MGKLRIAVVGPLEMPSTQGGMSRHCEELYSRLAARGHDITVFCQTAGAPQYRGMRLRRIPGVRVPGWERLGYSLLASLRSLFGRFDIVHYHSFASSGFCYLPRLGRKKVVVTVHRLEWQDQKWGRFARAFLKFCEWAAVRSSAVMITVSRTFKADLEHRYRRISPVHYVANGVTPPAPTGTDALVGLGVVPGAYGLTVGRLVSEKGLDLAVDAFAQLADDPGIAVTELVIVGGARNSDEYVAALESRVRKLGVNVRLLGVRTGAELNALYAHAAVFIASSYHEGQPLTVLEAMSHGRCVVASDISAHQELIGDAGVLFPSGDAHALAHELRRVLSDPQVVRELGEAARRKVIDSDEFRWDHTADETERILVAL
ncbi:MAG: glycosyltransferase family 4 protein [Acidimicrobiia bacterium]